MDATRLYLADCVGVIVLPISHIIIASVYKELRNIIINSNKTKSCLRQQLDNANMLALEPVEIM